MATMAKLGTRVFFLCALMFGVSGIAQAQTVLLDRQGFDANRLRLTNSRFGILNTRSAVVAPHMDWSARLTLGTMSEPVPVRSGGDVVGSLLENRSDLTLQANISLWEKLEFGLELPMTLNQQRSAGAQTTFGVGQVESSGVGDLVGTLKLALGENNPEEWNLAVGLQAGLFTGGGAQGYIAERNITLQPELILSNSSGPIHYAFNVAGLLRDHTAIAGTNVDVESELIARAGAGYRWGDFEMPTAEAKIALETFTSLIDPFTEGTSDETGTELHVGGDYQIIPGVTASAGIGLPLVRAVMVPAFRAWGGLRVWRANHDRDKDKILDQDDKCPSRAEDYDGFEDEDGCEDEDNDNDKVIDILDKEPMIPEDHDGFEDEDGVPDPDNDQDGMLDGDDKCPNEAEDKDGFEDEDGCPDTDNDADGVLDTDDKCPDVAEDKDGFEDEDGCADLDNDQDGIPDEKDGAPNEPEDIDTFQDEDGVPDIDNDGDGVLDRVDNCPLVAGPAANAGCRKKQLVVIRGCKIDLSQKVYFATGRSTIRSRSFPLLNNIASVLKAQSQLKQIRIEGHTDNVGPDQRNMKLSQARAEAVAQYLYRRGIATERLRAAGLGETTPIDDNNTKAGREANRRVEFHIEDCKEEVKEVELPYEDPTKKAEPAKDAKAGDAAKASDKPAAKSDAKPDAKKDAAKPAAEPKKAQ